MDRLKGFTFIEMILVIIVAAIVAGAFIISWPNKSISLDAQARAVRSDIRHTQNFAITKGERYQFVITSNNTYYISSLSGKNLTNRALSSGISFGQLTNLPNNLIVFDSKGEPYEDTATPGTKLTNTASIKLSATNGDTKTITINQETGKTSL